jgi:hypothetical protein
MACSIISGPIPSPAKTAMFNFICLYFVLFCQMEIPDDHFPVLEGLSHGRFICLYFVFFGQIAFRYAEQVVPIYRENSPEINISLYE